METTFAIICLLSFPVFLGVRHKFEYQENAFSSNNFGVASLLATLIYLMYLGLFLFQGIDDLYALKESGRHSNNFSAFFIAPSVGFGLAIFPKIASEYAFNFVNISSLEFISQNCALFGWLLIIGIFTIVIF